MPNLNLLSRATFEIELEFAMSSAGKSMQAQLNYDNTVYDLRPNLKNHCVQQIDVILPTKLKLLVWGKDMNNDTKLDAEGKILEDLYVKVTALRLDGFDASPIYLAQHLVFTTDNGHKIRSNYLGFNGCVEIDFLQPNVFLQVQNWRQIVG